MDAGYLEILIACMGTLLGFLARPCIVPPAGRIGNVTLHFSGRCGNEECHRQQQEAHESNCIGMERETGFEPATSTLARLHSTN